MRMMTPIEVSYRASDMHQIISVTVRGVKALRRWGRLITICRDQASRRACETPHRLERLLMLKIQAGRNERRAGSDRPLRFPRPSPCSREPPEAHPPVTGQNERCKSDEFGEIAGMRPSGHRHTNGPRTWTVACRQVVGSLDTGPWTCVAATMLSQINRHYRIRSFRARCEAVGRGALAGSWPRK